MSSRSLGVAAVTVIGIWQLLQSLGYASAFYPMMARSDPEFADAYGDLLVPFGFNALAGLALIFLRKRISDALFPVESEPSTLDPAASRAVLFSFAGLLLASLAAVTLASTEFKQFYLEHTTREQLREPLFQLQPSEDVWVTRVRAGTQLAIGLALLFGGRGLANLVESLRAGPR